MTSILVVLAVALCVFVFRVIDVPDEGTPVVDPGPPSVMQGDRSVPPRPALGDGPIST